MFTKKLGNIERIVKGLNLSLIRATVALGILAGTAYPVQAGLVTIKADPGSIVFISWYKTNGDKMIFDFDVKEDINNDGVVEFGFGSLEEEKKINQVMVNKSSDGNRTNYEIKLNANGESMGSLEPFNFPTFKASTSLLASIDMVAFKAAGNSFNVGQNITVNNGMISESSAITFKDSSSFIGFTEFTQDLVASLPNYTGSVNVYSLDNVSPVPLPATFWLMSTGLICLFSVRKKFQSQI